MSTENGYYIEDMADLVGAEAGGRSSNKKPKPKTEEPKPVVDLRKSGFKFGEVKEGEWKPEDRNLI